MLRREDLRREDGEWEDGERRLKSPSFCVCRSAGCACITRLHVRNVFGTI
ncbi:hypothetical protein MANES_13G083916v8 [Manihot esculenta]|uniref:Uncharacterized protein n=1 Tax=Manihot esculenta TaxID=3983 RepID=A0ACB7GKJ9_MANES|nr:hypothetical protein MANES_13G083916v8 [Manihot esculenta]